MNGVKRDGTMVDMLLPPLLLVTTYTTTTSTYTTIPPGLVAGGRAGLPISACCRWAGRPAVRYPAAGEGLRGRLRRSAVKLTPLIMFTDSCCRTGGNERSFGQTKGIFVDGSSGPTMLFWGFFFYWPESRDPFKNREK